MCARIDMGGSDITKRLKDETAAQPLALRTASVTASKASIVEVWRAG
jgi:hypothetical protein